MTGVTLFLVVLGIVLVAGVALAALAILGSQLLFRVFGKTSGLERLAERYPAGDRPEGVAPERQWAAVGGVYFAKNAEVCPTLEGLYLWVRPRLSRYQPALIPWEELRDPQPTVLFLQRAVRLKVGDPPVTTITFTERFFERVRGYKSNVAEQRRTSAEDKDE